MTRNRDAIADYLETVRGMGPPSAVDITVVFASPIST